MYSKTIEELGQLILNGDTDAMVAMADRLLNGSVEHSFFKAEDLLRTAAEKGNSMAVEKLESLFSNSICDLDELSEDELLELGEDDSFWDDDRKGEVDNLLSARYYHRQWEEMREEADGAKASELYELSVKEYEDGKRKMDDELLDALIFLTRYFEDTDKEKSLFYNKLGAENGQETLAYTWGLHLQRLNDVDGAICFFEKALHGQFSCVHAHSALAFIYLNSKGYFHPNKGRVLELIDEGIKLLEDTRSEHIADENCMLLYLMRGDYYYKTRDSKNAVFAYKQAIGKLKNIDSAYKNQLIAIAYDKLSELFSIKDMNRARKCKEQRDKYKGKL